MLSKKKRHFLLLEVLICFALIALCFLPLISPHVYILKAQKGMVDQIEVDYVISLLYADFYERLQKNEIPWDFIEDQSSHPITQDMLQRIGYNKTLPLKLSFKIEEQKRKPDKKEVEFVTAYLFQITYSYPAKDVKGKEIQKQTPYDLFIIRQLNAGVVEPPPQEPIKE